MNVSLAFLQKSTIALNRKRSDPNAKETAIEFLAFQYDNAECKIAIILLWPDLYLFMNGLKLLKT